MSRTVSSRLTACVCVALLVVCLLPMVGIAFYNHPFYDDFGFTIEPHAVWRETGDVGATLRAGWERAKLERQTWQGTYTSTVLSAVQPGVFSEDHYYWTTLLLLASYLLGAGFAFWAFCRELLGADRAASAAVVSLLLLVATQFLPDVSEAFYWFNGGFGYTFPAAMLYLSLGAAIKLQHAPSRRAAIGWSVALIPLLLLQGGGGYPCGLFSVCVFAFIALAAFCSRSRRKWAFLLLALWVAACFLYNCAAPGNQVRAATLGEGMSPLMAVVQAFYFGLALMGHFFSLPLLAALLAGVVLLRPFLKCCALSFRAPGWLTAGCVCLFCAQLAPTLYTGNYLGDGRVMDVYYYAYVAMSFLLTLYWAGWAQRRYARGQLEPSGAPKLVPLLVAGVLLAVGCASYRPEGAPSYGPQNMAGGSALRSLYSGQAARYDAAMDARDAAMNDPSQTNVTVAPVEDIPAVFMSDAVNSPMQEYVLRLYEEYYDKASVSLAGTE